MLFIKCDNSCNVVEGILHVKAFAGMTSVALHSRLLRHIAPYKGEDIEAQRPRLKCRRSHSWQVAEPRLESRKFDCKATPSTPHPNENLFSLRQEADVSIADNLGISGFA